MVITHYCGLCGEEIRPAVTLHGCQIQMVIPPCKTCIDEAIEQGMAKAIIENVTKREDLDEQP